MNSRKVYTVLAALAVMAINAPPVSATVTYDFDDGTLQGWSPGDPFGLGGFNGLLQAQSTGGNPLGFMEATDTVSGGGSLAAKAPSVLSGNLSTFGGLQWDEKIFQSTAVLGTSVLLEGTNGTFYRSEFPLLGIGTWQQRFVPFNDPTKWILFSGAASFDDVVSDVAALYIEMDASTNLGVESGVDNVALRAIPVPGAMTLFAGALAGLGFVGWKRRRAE